MLKVNRSKRWIAGVCLLLLENSYASSSFSSESKKWYFNAGVNITGGSYNNSPGKSSQQSGKILLGADYLEKTIIQFASSQSRFSYHNIDTVYSQNSNVFSLRQNIYSDYIDGRSGIQVAVMRTSGKDIVNVNSYIAKLDYLNYKKNIYGRLSYTVSKYGNSNNGFEIKQYKPGIGFQAYFKALWANVNWQYIQHENGKSFQAMSYGLTYFSANHSRYFPASVSAGFLNGKQQYAVDEEFWGIYNTDDIQKSAYYLAANWNLKDTYHLSLATGRETFANPQNQNYQLNYITSTLIKTW